MLFFKGHLVRSEIILGGTAVGQGFCWHRVDKKQGCYEIADTAQDNPPTRPKKKIYIHIYPAQNVNSAKTEKIGPINKKVYLTLLFYIHIFSAIFSINNRMNGTRELSAPILV